MKEKVLNVIGWFFVVLFFLAGAGALGQGEIVCFVLFAVLGVLTLPVDAVRKLWKSAFKGKSNLAKPVILLVLFMVAVSTLPAVEKDKNTEENTDAYKTETSNSSGRDEKRADSLSENQKDTNSDNENSFGKNLDDENLDDENLDDENLDDETLVNENSAGESLNNENGVEGIDNSLQSQTLPVSLSNIPEYHGSPYIAVNQNIPYFTESDSTVEAFEYYSDLDELGRCGIAYANICKEIMPTEERGKIGSIKPSGWQSVRYDNVDGAYLYNRCHLIGYQLAGENANEKNLITGTRYLNIEGMLPFENMVADYVEETDNHVLYRVTPVFEENNLVASGVLMEAKSVEDNGEGILFNVFCYNVQPGIMINYLNGDSSTLGDIVLSSEEDSSETNENQISQTTATYTYVLNKNTKKYHRPDCSSVPTISPKNRIDYDGDINEMIEQGYVACKKCNP